MKIYLSVILIILLAILGITIKDSSDGTRKYTKVLTGKVAVAEANITKDENKHSTFMHVVLTNTTSSDIQSVLVEVEVYDKNGRFLTDTSKTSYMHIPAHGSENLSIELYGYSMNSISELTNRYDFITRVGDVSIY
jgi:hypothetical protein